VKSNKLRIRVVVAPGSRIAAGWIADVTRSEGTGRVLVPFVARLHGTSCWCLSIVSQLSLPEAKETPPTLPRHTLTYAVTHDERQD